MNPISLKMCRNVIVAMLVMTSVACTGVRSFTMAARPGETIALAVGWRHYMDRDNVTVTITDNSSAIFNYAPGDPAVRAIVNTYPDPISKLRVGYETGQNLAGNETIWGTLIEGNVTGGDRDWSEKFILLDLPDGIAQGPATIDVAIALNGGGTENVQPVTVNILGGVGTSLNNYFFNWESGLSGNYVRTLERANHKTVTFSGSTLPYAIQLDLIHDPDLDSEPPGVGRAYVANAGGNVKNVHWTDDGQNMRVILMPAGAQSITGWNDFKFYVAGEITGLAVDPVSVQAFDINGVPVTDMDTPLVQ